MLLWSLRGGDTGSDFTLMDSGDAGWADGGGVLLEMARWGSPLRERERQSVVSRQIPQFSLLSTTHLVCWSVPEIKFCCEGATADAEEPEPVVLLLLVDMVAVELLFGHVNDRPFVELVVTVSLMAFIEKSWAENEFNP